MENKTLALGGMTLALLISLGYIVLNQPIEGATHRCDELKIVARCESLSSTGITCYTEPNHKGGKRCLAGWKLIEEKPIKDNKGIYTKCYSGNSEAYFGEKFSIPLPESGEYVGEADGKVWVCK